MSQPGSITRRIADCLQALDKKDYEVALVHFFPALDKTAKRRRPKEGVGSRIKKFLTDEEVLISTIATGIALKDVTLNGMTFADAIYKFGRTSIAHEGELDERLRITDSNALIVGEVWLLPYSYVWALCIAVMTAPENANERLPFDAKVTLAGREWQLNELWGAEAELKDAIAKVFRAPDLFSR